MRRLPMLSSLVVLGLAGCGPRPVMRMGSDRAVPAAQASGAGLHAPPPQQAARPGSSLAPADPTTDTVDPSTGRVREHDPYDPTTDYLDLDDGEDYPD